MATLKGITMNETAQEKWFLTLPFTTAVSFAVKFMLHMDFSDTSHHKDNPATVMHQIELTDRIVEVIKRSINAFTTTTKVLFNIMRGEIASKKKMWKPIFSVQKERRKKIGIQALCNYLSGDHPILK